MKNARITKRLGFLHVSVEVEHINLQQRVKEARELEMCQHCALSCDG